ncbi:MAG: ABC transporter ATP-binding protein [Clostridiales bacterium]|nr:ABC transporter ATP-binding protein [Clostridiales bacterium]
MLKVFKKMGTYGGYYAVVIVFIFIQSMADLTLPKKMQVIIDQGITQGNDAMIWEAGLQMLLFAAIVSVSAVIASLLAAVCGAGLAKNLRRAVFTKVTGATNNQLSQFGTASLITRTTNDVTQLQQFIVMSRLMIMAPVMGIGGVIMAVRTAPSLSWIIAAVILVVAVFVVCIFIKGNPLFKAQQKKLDNLNQVMREDLTGVRVIRAFNRTEKEQKRFEAANADLTGTALKIARLMAVMMPVTLLIMNLTTLLITQVSAGLIDTGSLEVGQMSAFIQYVMQIMMSLIMVSMIFVFIPRAAVSAERINKVLASEGEIFDPRQPASLPETGRGTLEFRDVTFRFAGAEEPVLSHISFTAKAGQTTAVIGSTGAGKTTLIDLVSRFYDIESGQILLDGVDIREIPQAGLRRRIGLVPQKAVLFTGTIAENIRFGKEDATDQEVRHAAQVAQAADFIESKPDGYDALLAQGGVNLSGGQKQRLSIARALVRRPEIYIFDDSFSALDFKTDAKLRAALKEETADSIMLVVAQRVSTIMQAEQILVLADGELAGAGTHKELFESCPVYREIVLSQHSEEEIA